MKMIPILTVAALRHVFNDVVNFSVYIASILVQSVTLHSSYPRMGGWMVGWIDGWMNGGIDGWRDGWMD